MSYFSFFYFFPLVFFFHIFRSSRFQREKENYSNSVFPVTYLNRSDKISRAKFSLSLL